MQNTGDKFNSLLAKDKKEGIKKFSLMIIHFLENI